MKAPSIFILAKSQESHIWDDISVV